MPTMNVGNDSFNSGFWIIALIALMNGGFGYGNRGNVATQDDLNFARLENQVRANAELTERKADAISNGICTLGYTMAEKFGQTNMLINDKFNRIENLMKDDKIDCLKGRVNQLELDRALYGVVRYPNGLVFTAGGSPFCNCNQGFNI